MKTEKVLDMLMAIYECLPEFQKEIANTAVEGRLFEDPLHNVSANFHKNMTDYSAEAALGEAIRATKCELIEEEIKKSGSPKRRNAIKRILKKGGECKDVLAYTEMIEGKQYFANRYVAYCLTETCAGLPVRTHDEKSFDFGKLFCRPDNRCVYELNLPTLTELKLTARKEKTADFSTYDFGENMPLVNLRYLIDLREIMPKARLFWDGKYMKSRRNGDYYCNSLYASDDQGNEAVIMPMAKKEAAENA